MHLTMVQQHVSWTHTSLGLAILARFGHHLLAAAIARTSHFLKLQ